MLLTSVRGVRASLHMKWKLIMETMNSRFFFLWNDFRHESRKQRRLNSTFYNGPILSMFEHVKGNHGFVGFRVGSYLIKGRKGNFNTLVTKEMFKGKQTWSFANVSKIQKTIEIINM